MRLRPRRPGSGNRPVPVTGPPVPLTPPVDGGVDRLGARGPRPTAWPSRRGGTAPFTLTDAETAATTRCSRSTRAAAPVDVDAVRPVATVPSTQSPPNHAPHTPRDQGPGPSTRPIRACSAWRRGGPGHSPSSTCPGPDHGPAQLAAGGIAGLADDTADDRIGLVAHMWRDRSHRDVESRRSAAWPDAARTHSVRRRPLRGRVATTVLRGNRRSSSTRRSDEAGRVRAQR